MGVFLAPYLLLFLFSPAPAQIGVEKALDIAVENALETADIVACSGIFDPLVGMQKIVADL